MRRIFLIALILAATASKSDADSFGSVRSGVWSDTSSNGPWGAVAAYPGPGDSVVINDPGHVVTVDIDISTGSDFGGYTFQVSSGATVIIAAGRTLQVHGSVLLYGTVELRAGSILEGGTTGGMGFWNVNVNAPTTIRTNGTGPGAARATIRPFAGATGLLHSGGYRFNCSYVNFTGAGLIGTKIATDGYVKLVNCVFDGCNMFILNSDGSWSGDYIINNCTFKNGLDSLDLSASIGPAGTGTGTRSISHNYFPRAVRWDYGVSQFAVDDNIFNAGQFSGSALYTGAAASFDRNLVRTSMGSNNGSLPPGNSADTYNLITEEQGNAYFLGSQGAFGVTLLRNTFDLPFGLAAGGEVPDCFFVYDSPNPGIVHRMSYCLTLPIAVGASTDSPPYNGKGTTSGCLQSGTGLSSGHVKIRLDHNTACSRTRTQAGWVTSSGDRVGPYLNEGASGYSSCSVPGSVDWLKDNLFWDDAPTSSGNHGFSSNGSTAGSLGPSNCLVPLNCHHNAYFGMTRVAYNDPSFPRETNRGSYYATPTSFSQPGGPDLTLTAPPSFVDPTRSFVTWAQMTAGLVGRTDAQAPGDVEAAIAEMAKLNDDSGFNPAYTVTALNNWVRAGWAPMNPQLAGRASDGTTPGAIQGLFPAKIISTSTATPAKGSTQSRRARLARP